MFAIQKSIMQSYLEKKLDTNIFYSKIYEQYNIFKII